MAHESIFSSEEKMVAFDPEFTYDNWVLKNLAIPLDIRPSTEKINLRFDKIEKPTMKFAIKIFLYYRLMTGYSLKTVACDRTYINAFAQYCCSSGIDHFSQVERGTVLAYVSYIRNKNLSASSTNGYLNTFSSFNKLCCLLNIPYTFKKQKLLPKEVYAKEYDSEPDPYSDTEIRNLTKHIKDIEPTIRKMLIVMLSMPIRYTEVSELKSSQLLEVEGEYYLRIHMYKTRELKTIPIPKKVGEILKDQIENPTFLWGKKKGESAKALQNNEDRYVFINRSHTVVERETFVNYMKAYVERYDIRDDEGEPLHIRTHRFRAYTTTKLINQGVDPVIVSMLLGHKTADSLKHYAKLYGKRIHEVMKPVLEDREWHIKNMGNTLKLRVQGTCPTNLDSSVKLSNGQCLKPLDSGICDHANACYRCVYFIPNIEDKKKYQMQLAEAKSDLSVAHTQGLKRLEEYNEDLITWLNKVIDKIEPQE